MISRLLCLFVAVLVVAGCTSDERAPEGGPQPSSSVGAPTEAGPVREVRVAACPLARTSFVQNTMGMRLGRVTKLRGGGVSGCRFYGLHGSPLQASEHLPGPRQPVVEILIRRFGSRVEARNAVVFLARASGNPQRLRIGRTPGLCFQTSFYPKDRGKDWACAANVGRTEVVVHSVDTTGTFSTAALTRAVLRRV